MPASDEVVLSVGSDRHLLDLREQILQRAGFQVISAHNEAQAIQRMPERAFRALVLCHSLRKDAQQRLIRRFRKLYPGGRIVAVGDVPWELATDADTAVQGVEGPDALIAAIRGTDAA